MLIRMTKNGDELKVEPHQIARYEALGWTPEYEDPKGPPIYAPRPKANLVEVWKGDEMRRCEPEQLRLMASMGFEPRTVGVQVEPVKIAATPVQAPDSTPAPVEAPASPEPVVEEPEEKKPTRRSTDDEIREAFAKLDPDNDEHWTQLGAPKLDVLNALLPEGSVNRTQVNAATGNATRPGR